MVGDPRIIALGPNGSEDHDTDAAEGTVTTRLEDTHEGSGYATSDPAHDEDEIEAAPAGRAVAPVAALVAALAWTAFFAWTQVSALRSGIATSQIPALVGEWALPVLLIGMALLLALRLSTREARRFNDAARQLAGESALLERRLTVVNRELSLAREFLAAQSRELESLGRIAIERISGNAGRLSELVAENGDRLEAIGTVSAAALENMDKLRGHLPVIAHSAKDVTNQIGNAGRTAHGQLEELAQAFAQLQASGETSARQVADLKGTVDAALAAFDERSDQLEATTRARFAALADHGDTFRDELAGHETAALAAIQTRAEAMTAAFAESRQELGRHEEDALARLSERLAAIRSEGEVVSRELRGGEDRAVEAWQSALDGLEAHHHRLTAGIATARDQALASLTERLDQIEAEAEKLEARIEAGALRASVALDERRAEIVLRDEQAAERFARRLAEMDGELAERVARHDGQAGALAAHAAEVTRELENYEARLAAIAAASDETGRRVGSGLDDLATRLEQARAAMGTTDGDLARLGESAGRLLELVETGRRSLDEALPGALAAGEAQVARLREDVAALIGDLSRSLVHGGELAEGVEASGLGLRALLGDLETAHARLAEHADRHGASLDGLADKLGALDSRSGEAASRAQGELSAALAALGEALDRSVEQIEADGAARIAAVADLLASAGGEAMEAAMRNRAAHVTSELQQTVLQATEVTGEAAERLRGELSRIAELLGHLEGRTALARQRAEERIDTDFARRVALLSESLNSNAIDIARVLATEVPDTAWAAYLRGDRGIFTRRAVSLLEAGEAKRIVGAFEGDESFREQVSRYIHDFEAILREVLSTRDGNALAVTLLSSDMGKLYVALAQGIERLRT